MLFSGNDRSDYPLPEFYDRMYELVEDPSTDSIISWSESNKGFIVRNKKRLIRRKMYSRFYCSTYKEFISTIKSYGFSKIKRSDGRREFGSKYFVRGQPILMTEMHVRAVMKRINKGVI